MLGPSLRSTEQEVCEAAFNSFAAKEPTPGMFLSITNSGTRNLPVRFKYPGLVPASGAAALSLVESPRFEVGRGESRKVESVPGSAQGQAGRPTVCRASTT